VSHVEGEVSPERDIETIATELILADLQTLERAAPRLAKEIRAGKDPERKRVAHAVAAAERLLDDGKTLFAGAAGAGIELDDLAESTCSRPSRSSTCSTPTRGPAGQVAQDALVALVAPAEAIFLDVKTEAEWRAARGRDGRDGGRARPRRARAVPAGQAGFHALGRTTFLTAGPKEARAWRSPSAPPRRRRPG